MDGLKVDDGGVTAEVEQILAAAKIAGAAPLFAGEVRERVLDLHTLAQAFAPG